MEKERIYIGKHSGGAERWRGEELGVGIEDCKGNGDGRRDEG
jgi:hypothetical protein